MHLRVSIGIVLLAMVSTTGGSSDECDERQECFFGDLYPTIVQFDAARIQHSVTPLHVPEQVYAALARFAPSQYCSDHFEAAIRLKKRLNIPTVIVRPENTLCGSRRIFSPDDIWAVYVVLLLSLAMNVTIILLH